MSSFNGLATALSFLALGAYAADLPDNSDLDQLVDPTAPLSMNNTQPAVNLLSLQSNYRVNSILIRPNMKVAVINSRQVREGDLLGNAEVVRIDKRSVTLRLAGEEQVLELYARSIRSDATGEN